MTDTNGHKQAVILSGGGANGAYEVGVMKALFGALCPATNGKPLDPDIFAGTSVGSFNAAFLVSKWESYTKAATSGPLAVADLEKVWIDDLSGNQQTGRNGVYRFLANPLEFLNPNRFLFSPVQTFTQLSKDSLALFRDFTYRVLYIVSSEEEPLQERLLSLVNIDNLISREPFQRVLEPGVDFDAIRNSNKVLRVAATGWEIGEFKTFSNHDFSDTRGPQIILASSAIPGFFPVQNIGASPFVDGSVLLNTPLILGKYEEDGQEQWADTLHVVYLDPDVNAIPISYLNSLLSVQYRVNVINWAAKVNDDIEDARRINEGVEIWTKAEAEDPGAQGVLQGLRGILPDPKEYSSLTIHRYHPQDPLGGPLGLLDFARERIQDLIDRGFNDAVYHDCDESDCVIPGKPGKIPNECRELLRKAQVNAEGSRGLD